MVKIVCPSCNFSKEIPEERISPAVKWAICPQCRNRFQFRNAAPLAVVDPSTVVKPSSGSTLSMPRAPVLSSSATAEDGEARGSRRVAPGPPETGVQTKRDRILSPWERRSDIGLLGGASQTLKAVLFSPTDFFKHTAVEGGLKEPLAFGLLTGSLGMMFEIFWKFLFLGEGRTVFGDTLFGPYAMIAAFLGAMAFCPLFTFFAILITSLIMHVLLIPVRGGTNGFEATFRVTSFCQATQVWGMVPIIGGLIGAFWFFAVQLIGLKEIHETSYLRVAVALITPLVFILLLLVLMMVKGWI